MDYNNFKINELLSIAKDLKIKNYSKLKKNELIEILNNLDNSNSSTTIDYSKNELYNDSKIFSSEDQNSGIIKKGVLEISSSGFGFIRGNNFLPDDTDVYISVQQIKRYNLKSGDYIEGFVKKSTPTERFPGLCYFTSINNCTSISENKNRKDFKDLTPIYPTERIKLEYNNCPLSMRLIDIISPIGKGQRAMIVAPPKVGKTTLIKQLATSIKNNNPDIHMIILLVDERPEEVTDIKEKFQSENCEIIYSTFDELPERHTRVAEMVIEHAKRYVELKKDVVILLDSITRLARAYNFVVPSSGRVLSGGLEPGAIHMPKKFFGAARNIREGGSLTILATALVDTGSRMDDVIFEEFKGTGNMEVFLDRNMSEKGIFPAINIFKSSTRMSELLLTKEEQKIENYLRRNIKNDDNIDKLIKILNNFNNNNDFIHNYLNNLNNLNIQ